MSPTIPFLDLQAVYREDQPAYDAAYRRVMDSGRWVLGPELSAFETDFAAACGRRHAIGVGNGLDALALALQVAGIGTTLSGINLIATIVKMRAPGMTLMKMPIFTWSALTTNTLIVAAFPILTAVLAMLSLDRYLGTNFFTNKIGRAHV